MRVLWLMVVSVVLAVGLLLWSWPRAELQRQKLTQYKPVLATVVASDVAVTATGRYQPVVEFRYRMGGATYTAGGPQAFTAAPVAGDLAWARGQIETLTKDTQFTAYYNPEDPAQAFAVRRVQFIYYAMALLPTVVLTLMVVGLERAHFFSTGPAATAGGPFGWYRLNVWESARGRIARAMILAAIWYGNGVAVAWHYMACGVGTPWAHLLVLGLYALVGLTLVVQAVRLVRVADRLGEAEVQATLPSFETDGMVNVRVRQRARRKVRVRGATMSLTCVERTGLVATECLYAADHEFARDQEVLPGFSISGEHSFSIFRKKLPPSTAFSRWRLPRVEWQVEVVTQLARGGTYRAAFPIVLRQAHHEAAAAEEASELSAQ